MTQTVLVVGGAGYIGSHICKALKARGDLPVVFDSLSAGHAHAVQWGPLIQGDLRDASSIDQAIRETNPDAIMHFAGSIEVGEGEKDPLGFWQNNVAASLNLLNAMRRQSVERIVFSSTCAIYGVPEKLPITEDTPANPINVYGRTKLAVETLLFDMARAHGLRAACLRYFNAAGASPDGEIGEEHDPETHLIPNALKAAAGPGEGLKLFGNDYPTRDGTCIRDYIHVMDLAEGHLRALDRLASHAESFACNLGTGHGSSVREIIDTVEQVTGRNVPYEQMPRRPGDAPELLADITRARSLLGFQPQHSSTEQIIKDAWRFHSAKWLLAG
jgi:UDP-arabinose 4-epimerase